MTYTRRVDRVGGDGGEARQRANAATRRAAGRPAPGRAAQRAPPACPGARAGGSVGAEPFRPVGLGGGCPAGCKASLVHGATSVEARGRPRRLVAKRGAGGLRPPTACASPLPSAPQAPHATDGGVTHPHRTVVDVAFAVVRRGPSRGSVSRLHVATARARCVTPATGALPSPPRTRSRLKRHPRHTVFFNPH